MDDAGQDSALLDAILEAAVDAIVVANEAGIIQRVNPAACRLFDFSPEELKGKSINMLMPQALANRHDGFVRHHLDTGEMRVIGTGRELEGVRKDKTTVPLHLSVGRFEVQDQAMFVSIMHELTHRKMTEAALARSQRLDAIGQMTGGIAHDFNNLLTVVIGNLELLEMRGPTDRQMPLLKDALHSAQLGAELTDRLMAFARKGQLSPVKVDLRDLCENTLAILRRTLGAGYVIKTDYAPDLRYVIVDPAQVQSALMNLALNARDAMVDGGELLISVSNVTIDDTYIAQETDIALGDYVRLSVSDNGAGMSHDEQKRAFEPFFTTKAESGGTGLGLATVYGFVRQSGGHITVYSELGHGTSFGLYFPAVLDSIYNFDEPGTAPADHTSLKGGGETVLVVEDNPKVRKLSSERIRDLGFVAVEADCGEAAYNMLRDGLQVDIVFSDLVMPGALNGYDLAAKVASEFPGVKVLLTSGYASDVVTSSMAKNQTHDILHKPYRQSELALRLQALLTGDEDG
ncbi:MAG: PAS domain S-box protein [Pseudomonadota bacterium]